VIVDKLWFGGVPTDEQAQLMANAMAVTPYYFSEVSCEGDRLFGVVTSCRRETCEETCETVLNGCARKNLWQYAFMVQQELEATLRWTLTPRYVTETLLWDGKSHVKLTYGGVEKLLFQESATTVDSDIEYHPFVDQVTALAVLGQSYVEVLIPMEYLSTPEGVMFKNPNTGRVIAYTDIIGYPHIRTVGLDKFWAIAIPGGFAAAGDTLDVLDCVWGYVDAPDISEEDCSDEVAIVYPDTVQKIPIEKVTDDRWYIKHAFMVRKEYIGDTIDLTQFQTHKLYDVVDVACFGETCSLITIHKKCSDAVTDCDCDAVPCEEVEADGCATLISREAGIIEIHEVEVIVDDDGDPVLDSNGCPTFRQKTDCTATGDPFKVTVSYRTNPALTGIMYTSAVETLRRAIASRVAAEVSLVDCGCNVECGFFKEMRVQTNTTTFTQSGATIVSLRYGNKVGQQVYSNALENVPRNQPFGMA
jgi:hypothetical protein